MCKKLYGYTVSIIIIKHIYTYNFNGININPLGIVQRCVE